MLAEAEQTLAKENENWKVLQEGVATQLQLQTSFETPLQPLFKGALEDLMRHTECLAPGPRQQLLRTKLQEAKPEVDWGFQFCYRLASLGHSLAETYPTMPDTRLTDAMEY